MKYYELYFDTKDESLIFCDEDDIGSMESYDIVQGKALEKWNEAVTFYYSEQGRVSDYLNNVLDWPIVSSRIKAVFEKLQVQGGQWLPVKIKKKNSHEELNGYFVLNVCNFIDALDMEKSNYFKEDPLPEELTVGYPVLQEEKLQGVDIFRVKRCKYGIYISQRLKKALQKEKLTGMDFDEVEISGGEEEQIVSSESEETESDADGKKKFTDEDYQQHFIAKRGALEKILGKMHDTVGHSFFAFQVGGPVDMYYFPKAIEGTALVTMELIEPDGSGPLPNRLGTYELIAFTKHKIEEKNESKSIAFNKIEERICHIFTMVGDNSFQRKIEPQDTGEIPPQDEGENICVVFDEYKKKGIDFKINNKKHGLLLCIEVFRQEMVYAIEEGSNKLLEKLKEKGYYPYSDLDREPVV